MILRLLQISLLLFSFNQLALANPETSNESFTYWGAGLGILAVPNDHNRDIEGGVAPINQVLIGKQYDMFWRFKFLTEAGYLQTYDSHIDARNHTSGFWIGMGFKLDLLSEKDKLYFITRQGIADFNELGGYISEGIEYKFKPNLSFRAEVEAVNFLRVGFRFHGIYRF